MAVIHVRGRHIVDTSVKFPPRQRRRNPLRAEVCLRLSGKAYQRRSLPTRWGIGLRRRRTQSARPFYQLCHSKLRFWLSQRRFSLPSQMRLRSRAATRLRQGQRSAPVPLDPPKLAEQFAVRVAGARALDLRAYNSMAAVARDRPFLCCRIPCQSVRRAPSAALELPCLSPVPRGIRARQRLHFDG
jgi:hypothetical protein